MTDPNPWATACRDWEDRILAGRTLVPETLPLIRTEADRAEAIFRRLRAPDIAGKPRLGDIAGDWLYPIIRAIFGSYDPDTGRRAINEFFWLIPKKNSKTSTAAAIAVTALIVCDRPEAEIVLVAPTKDVADLGFRQASATIRADDELAKLFQVQTHIRCVTHRRTGVRLIVKAADTDVITGGKQVITIIDEIHVLAAKPNADEIMIELKGSLAARPDGFVLTITTQSKQPPRGVFKSELAKARAVRDGKLDLPLLPILYELPERLTADNGWKDETLWPFVNPNLGRSVDPAYLRRELIAAEDAPDRAEKLALIASQHFNVEVGLSLRSDRWAGADFWPQAAEPVTLADLVARCEVATVGCDGGGLDDLFGLYVIGRERGTGIWLGWGRAWAHRIVAEKRKAEASRLEGFASDGDLVWHGEKEAFVPKRRGDSSGSYVPTDVEGIVATVKQVDEAGILHAVGLDPAGVGAIVDALSAADIGSADDEARMKRKRVVGISQGFALQRGIKTLERKLADGTFVPADQPLVAWCAGNARVEQKANYVQVSKAMSGAGKIDVLMAAFDAAFLMADNPEPPNASIYTAARGLTVFG